MKYILLIYGDEKSWAALSTEEMEKIYEGHRQYGAHRRRTAHPR